MAKIHEVAVESVLRYDVDPRRGLTARKEQILKPSATHRLSVDEGVFDAVDGTFDVPPSVAERFLAQPGWYPGPNPFATPQATEAAEKPAEPTPVGFQGLR